MTASLVCTGNTVNQVEEYARQLHKLVCQYKWITESYVVEFFVKDHWGHLPPSWQLSLASLTPPDIAEVLLQIPESTLTRTHQLAVWPLSLLAFRAATHALALRRTVVQPAQVHPQSGRNPHLSHCYRAHVKPKKQHEIERLAEVLHSTCEQVGCSHIVDIGSGQGHLSRLLSFGYNHRVTSIEAVDCHVTGAAKFDQEVKTYFERKARAIGTNDQAGILTPHHVVCTVHPYITVEEFLSVISAHTQSNQGGGRSHFTARVDHFEQPQRKPVHEVKRMKIESVNTDPGGDASKVDSCQSCSNRCRNQRSTDSRQNNPSKSFCNSSCPLTHDIPPSTDSKTERFCQNASSCVDCSTNRHPTEKDPQANHEKFLVAGLHTCGDLGPTVLRTFAECPLAVALASVACCYMRMSFCDKSPELHIGSEPMSSNFTPKAPNSTSNVIHPSTEPVPESFQTKNLDGGEVAECSSQKDQNASGLDVGFPMSRRVKSLCSEDGSMLTFEPLELACHFLERYRVRLTDGGEVAECSSQKDQNASGLDVGFPMSRHVKSLCSEDGSMLTFEPLELACHFLERYRVRLTENDPSLLTQGYRAALEVIIQEQCVGLTQTPDGARKIRKAVGSVKRPHLRSFEDYASTILGKLGLQSDPGRIRTLRETLLPRWQNLVTYHTIRQLLAPIVESLVLVDRALFLLEKGVDSRLVPIFDPLLSPRNLVLIAVKKD